MITRAHIQIYQAVIAFVAFIVTIVWITQYLNASAQCRTGGIVVKDAIGMPVCVRTSTVILSPTRP